MSQTPPEPSAAFTIDLRPDGGTETGGQTFGRIIAGIALMVIGLIIGLGSIALFAAAFVVPALLDWFDVIAELWWIIGLGGLVLLILGFELLRRGRKRNRSAVASTFETLAASGIIDADEPPARTAPEPPKPGTTIV